MDAALLSVERSFDTKVHVADSGFLNRDEVDPICAEQ
jgi:hypothetical protein